MCDPVTALAVVSTATAAASSVASFVGQGQKYGQNEIAANLAYASNQNVDAQKATQVDQQQSQNTLEAAIARAKGLGRVSASASSMGADAASTAADVQGVDFSVGRQLGVENINASNSRLQIANDETGNWFRKQSQINSVEQASPAALGIGLAGDALSGATTYAKLGGRF